MPADALLAQVRDGYRGEDVSQKGKMLLFLTRPCTGGESLSTMPLSISVAFTALVGLAASIAIPETHAVHEKRDAVSRQKWIKRDRIEPHVKLPMRVGLKQNNLEKGHQWLMEVSHPDSPQYGQHWSQDKVIGSNW